MAEEATTTANQTSEAPQSTAGAVSKFVKDTQNAMGKRFMPTNIAAKVADGDYEGAAISAGFYAGFKSKTWEAVEKVAPKVVEYGGKALDVVVDVAKKPQILAEAIGEGAPQTKRIPVVGAVVTAGFVLAAVGKNAQAGNFSKASAELSAGCAETIGNIAGFGVGDAARETVREIFVQNVGVDNAPAKSQLRGFAERSGRILDKAVIATLTDTAEIESLQNRIVDGMTKDPLPVRDVSAHYGTEEKRVPETLMIEGKETKLIDALRNPEYNQRVREYLENIASRKSGYDTSSVLADLDKFNALEEKKKSLETAAAPAESQKMVVGQSRSAPQSPAHA